MKILITGNMGYVGSELSRFIILAYPNAQIIGYDSAFFGHCLTGARSFPECKNFVQYFGDVRQIDPSILSGVDCVVHLAAISNDPMGTEFENVTDEINRRASVRLAEMSAAAGVKCFVFASSCSVYGFSEGGPVKESDPTNALTAYARSKVGAEDDIKKISLKKMVFTSLRFATACGWSRRLRLDLVLNDFVACALSSGKISILSDGTPWRPLIDVEDMAKAIVWAAARSEQNGGQYLVVNAGNDRNNYQVSQLAKAVAARVSETTIFINKSAPSDSRSYSVDFSLYAKLAPQLTSNMTLDQSIQGLIDGLVSEGFSDDSFRNSSLMRLNVLRGHLSSGRLGQSLFWQEELRNP